MKGSAVASRSDARCFATAGDTQRSTGGRERPILMSAPMVRAILDGRKTQMRRILTQHNSTVLGDRWGRNAPWVGLDFSDAKPRTQSSIMRYVAGDDAPRDIHLDVPFLHPADAAHGMEWDGCVYRVRPQWEAGDVLWVRETWAANEGTAGGYLYRADHGMCDSYARADLRAGVWTHICTRWRPSIHMPRAASRISLRVTDVRVERLNDINEADAIAEGLYKSFPTEEDREWLREWTEDRTGAPPTAEEIADFEKGVWMVPGVPQGWGLTRAERARDQWAPTPQFAYRQIWEHINGPGSWDANPWVWAMSFEVITPLSAHGTSSENDPLRDEDISSVAKSSGSFASAGDQIR